MTIAEVRLYSYGLDRARGDIPIFATAAAEAAAGAGTGVTTPTLTFSSVKTVSLKNVTVENYEGEEIIYKNCETIRSE